MNIVRREPWSLLDQVQNEINRAFLARGEREDTSATSDWMPAVDIEEHDDKFVLLADVPGVAPDQIDVTLEDSVLTIQGERNEERTEATATAKRTERVRGRFHRRFLLPDTASAEEVSATGRNGVLEIVIPKVAPTQPRKITVS